MHPSPQNTNKLFLKIFFAPIDFIAYSWFSSFSSVSLDTVPSCPDISNDEVELFIWAPQSGKAPRPDLIPNELFKSNPCCWAKVLASVFTSNNSSGQIPRSWRYAIIALIFKEGNKSDPGCRYTITLLSWLSKLYSSFLSHKLWDRVESRALLGNEKVGFRRGCSTLEHCLILYHIGDKYTANNEGDNYLQIL